MRLKKNIINIILLVGLLSCGKSKLHLTNMRLNNFFKNTFSPIKGFNNRKFNYNNNKIKIGIGTGISIGTGIGIGTSKDFELRQKMEFTYTPSQCDKDEEKTEFYNRIQKSFDDKRFLLPNDIIFEDIPDKCKYSFRLGFLNLKTRFSNHKYPQFPNIHYPNRDPRIIEQIKTNCIDILGFCEGTHISRLEKLKISLDQYKIMGYCTGEKGTYYHCSLNKALKLSKEQNIDPYIEEVVGFIYDSTRFNLWMTISLALPEGQKHIKTCIRAHFEDTYTKKQLVIYSFNLNDMDMDQRKKSLEIIKKDSNTVSKEDAVFLMGDTNFFLDQQGKDFYNDIISKESGFYDPRKVAKRKIGQDGTVIGNPTWDQKFIPQTKITSWLGNYFGFFGNAYKDGTPLDLILARVPSIEEDNIYYPTFAAVLPGYFDQKTKYIYEISEITPNVVCNASTISDHAMPVVEFSPVSKYWGCKKLKKQNNFLKKIKKYKLKVLYFVNLLINYFKPSIPKDS